ncbi:hypothetical protein Mal52_30000 [Symmachiella dynata]|uniref:Uncharacterized protein n=1 Tax=Symmachiella dynata TaxID=2527995 RepID=A0A517ZQ05_9PLAN|nr:hypothetical protein Mal52_30000 [Symmachiella dynata]
MCLNPSVNSHSANAVVRLATTHRLLAGRGSKGHRYFRAILERSPPRKQSR